MAAGRLLLPMEAAIRLPCQAQGWRVATQIAPSVIAGAGNGRFAREDISAGSIVAVKPVRAMAAVETLHSVGADRALTFCSAAELEQYIHLGVAEGGFTVEQSRETLEHYLWSLDGVRGVLNWSTWSLNHGGGSEMKLHTYHDRAGGAEVVVSEAAQDIPSGTELTMDYCAFDMPEFYLEYVPLPVLR